MEYHDFLEQNYSLFGRSCKLTGIFVLRGPAHVRGELEGEIIVENDSTLIIEREGLIKGNIKCENLEIHGRFEGIIEARGTLTIHPSAEIYGEMNAKNLIIHPGADLNADVHTLV